MEEYKIKLGDLKQGINSFSYKIKDAFFESFPLSEIKSCEVSAIVEINKCNNSVKLSLKLDGKVHNLLCDLCAENISLSIKTKTQAIIGKANFDEKLYDDIILNNNENYINVKQFIFESIILNIPEKKQHGLDKNGKLKCNKKMIDLIEKYSHQTVTKNDDRWNVLKNLNLK